MFALRPSIETGELRIGFVAMTQCFAALPDTLGAVKAQVLAFSTFGDGMLAVCSGERGGAHAVLVVDRLGLIVQVRRVFSKQIKRRSVLFCSVAASSTVLAGHVAVTVLWRVIVERVLWVADNSLVQLSSKFARKARVAIRALTTIVGVWFTGTAVDAK